MVSDGNRTMSAIGSSRPHFEFRWQSPKGPLRTMKVVSGNDGSSAILFKNSTNLFSKQI